MAPEEPGRLQSAIAGALVGLLVIFRDVSFALVYCAAPSLQASKSLMMAALLLSSCGAQLVYTKKHGLPTAIACTSSAAVPFQSASVKKGCGAYCLRCDRCFRGQ